MAVSTHSNNKKNTSGAAASTKSPLPKWLPKKPLTKQVLASPCVGVWPTLGKKATMQVTNAFVQCALAKTDVNILKPPWKELRKLEPKLRHEAVAKYRSEALNRLSPQQKEALLEALAKEKDQLLHVFFGYNQIMRALQRGEVAALLINKTATPELLPLSLIPACSAKGLPVVALENLGTLWRKCIAIAFKESVKSQECSFHPLYQKMVKVTRKATDSASEHLDAEDERKELTNRDDIPDDESSIPSPAFTKHDLLLLEEKRLPPSTIIPNASSSKGSCGRRHRPPPPTIDVSRYHLTRTRTDQRAFIPGVGMNRMAGTAEEELIMVTTDVAGLRGESMVAGFDYRDSKNMKRDYHGKKAHRGEASVTDTLGDHPSGEAGSSAAHRDVSSDEEEHSKPIVSNLEKKSSHLMFQLDFEGNETSLAIDAGFAATESFGAALPKPEDFKKTATVKRKRSKQEKCSPYVPASVMRLVANAKRKKK